VGKALFSSAAGAARKHFAKQNLAPAEFTSAGEESNSGPIRRMCGWEKERD